MSKGDSYWVKSSTALSDYLKYRPGAVVEIRTKPREDHDIRAQLAAKRLSIPVKIGADASEPGLLDESPLAFRVTVATRPEEELWARLEQTKPRNLLMLDHVQDPRNLGAIVRSAAFFGIREVLVPSRRQVLITPSAVATAQGGFALVDLFVMTNLTRSLEALKKQGYWAIGGDAAGAPVGPKSFDFDRVVLVLGAEHKGLAPLVAKTCDTLVAIPRSASGFDSLNVSVACGILLHELVKKCQATQI